MADKEHDEALHDEPERQRPSADEQAEARKAARPADGDPVKQNPLEYFGADGEDEGQKYVDSGEASKGDDDQTVAPG
jgi:hypothetical protein